MYLLFMVLEIKASLFHVLGNCASPQLHSQPQSWKVNWKKSWSHHPRWLRKWVFWTPVARVQTNTAIIPVSWHLPVLPRSRSSKGKLPVPSKGGVTKTNNPPVFQRYFIIFQERWRLGYSSDTVFAWQVWGSVFNLQQHIKGKKKMGVVWFQHFK